MAATKTRTFLVAEVCDDDVCVIVHAHDTFGAIEKARESWCQGNDHESEYYVVEISDKNIWSVTSQVVIGPVKK